MPNRVLFRFDEIYAWCSTIEYLLEYNESDFENGSLMSNFIQNMFEKHGSELRKFSKESLLHRYIAYCIRESEFSYLYEKYDIILDLYMQDFGPRAFPLYALLTDYGANIPCFPEYLRHKNMTISDDLSRNDIFEYYLFLEQTLEYAPALMKVVEEIFYILFSNRNFLYLFNRMASNSFKSSGTNPFKRMNIPSWVKKSVYHRDKGKCCLCFDPVGGHSDDKKDNYDHIIPVSRFGFNDVTNVQLLCESCNKSKGNKSDKVGREYYQWY